MTNDPKQFKPGVTYDFYHRGSLTKRYRFLGRVSAEESHALYERAKDGQDSELYRTFWIHSDGATDIIMFAGHRDDQCCLCSAFVLAEICEIYEWAVAA